ncbi:hypothetical protein E4656_17150 [Natronospirillum operosum]|uniref:Uncharacterized protein n=1 Tax=Natronospirillum operosum TaxID=2759953 RepID=A0A4Z0WBT0_9GAMM|nr:hypothetical protein [Natronospirillum operosum]TGG91118.1 hypothetical protein E4656_17150 [Natronospirillum operosum]
MITVLAFVALHMLLLFVIGYLTVKAAPERPWTRRIGLFLGIAVSTLPPVGWLQWWWFRNRDPAYAESCMLQSLAGIGYLLMSAYGLEII